MKRHSLSSRQTAGFTLIEMLVVIGIIALLATIAVPAANGVLQRARALQAKTMMKGVEVAVNAYKSEYGRLPLAAGSSGEVTYALGPGGEGDNGLDLLETLMADTNQVTTNPRQIKFYDPPTAKGNRNGYVEDVGLVDPWGNGITLLINYDYETTPISNPYAHLTGEPENLNSAAILYSSGPDRISNNKDDVRSW